MKIVSLIGSPRGSRGNTATLLKEVLKGTESQGAQGETITLQGDSVLPCKACDQCHKKGRCPQKDDFTSIKQKIVAADGLILASPNYIFNVSAQMKAFMDRCCGVIHCMAFEGKYGAGVVTSGGGEEKPIAAYMNHFLMTTGITPVGAVWATMGTMSNENLPEEICLRAFNLGKKLVHSWKTHRRFSRVEKKKEAFQERMRQLMLYRRAEWPYEHEYWQKHRGL